jgi:hypothetical protein
LSNRHLGAFTTGYQTGNYQPASWSDSIGNFFGNLGNNWAGGEDQAMFASPNSTMANPGGATATGAYNAGQAVEQGAGQVFQAVASPVTGFLSGLLHGGGMLIGAGIILVTLINAREE